MLILKVQQPCFAGGQRQQRPFGRSLWCRESWETANHVPEPKWEPSTLGTQVPILNLPTVQGFDTKGDRKIWCELVWYLWIDMIFKYIYIYRYVGWMGAWLYITFYCSTLFLCCFCITPFHEADFATPRWPILFLFGVNPWVWPWLQHPGVRDLGKASRCSTIPGGANSFINTIGVMSHGTRSKRLLHGLHKQNLPGW